MTIRIDRTVIAPYAAADMYALVDDIAAYPDFLPWCERAEVKRGGEQEGGQSGAQESEQEGEEVWARLDIRYAGFRTAFATQNRHTPAERIQMRLAEGPLSNLAGEWRFIAIEAQRCRIEFNLHYAFSNRLMDAMLKKIFAHVFDHFVDHFIERAHARYRTINVEVVQVQADGAAPRAQTLRLPATATVGDALAAAQLAHSEAVSLFGRPCAADTPLGGGERIEINQPLRQAPQQMRRGRQ